MLHDNKHKRCSEGKTCWISRQTAAVSVKVGKFTDTLKVQQQSKERGSEQKQTGETSSATNGGEVRWGKSWINKYSQTRLLTHHFLHKSKNLPVLHVRAESQWKTKPDVNFHFSQSQVSVSFSKRTTQTVTRKYSVRLLPPFMCSCLLAVTR